MSRPSPLSPRPSGSSPMRPIRTLAARWRIGGWGIRSAARQDEEKAQELGGPERNAWERLCNRSRRRWGREFDDPRWKQEDPLSRQAVLLEILNTQILNGGLRQWIANGYGQWIEDVIAAASAVGTESTREVAAMLQELAPHLDAVQSMEGAWEEDEFDEVDNEEELDEMKDEVMSTLYELEDRYHRVQMDFIKDLEQWFEKQAGTGI